MNAGALAEALPGRQVRVTGLATYVWEPAGPVRAVLVTRTPYGAHWLAPEAAGWTARGVAFVAQDVRGRYASPGEFVPYAEHRSDDGPALLDWVRSWSPAPVVLYGTSYGAHAALATAARSEPDGVVVCVPALGLGETARTRGGVLQLASRVGWWLEHDVRRPWHEVVAARRTDAERAAAVAQSVCPLLAIGGTDDHFAHDTLDLWAAWGGPAQLVLGSWDHSLGGARRGERILAWLDTVLAGRPAQGATAVHRDGTRTVGPPPTATLHLDAEGDTLTCASLAVPGPDGTPREIAHGAAYGPTLTLGPVVLNDRDRVALRLWAGPEDFPRYARDPRATWVAPDHRLEITP